ncbi:MAG: hypothetical protein R3D30_10050 [Hyphomicrobiales bacterium]
MSMSRVSSRSPTWKVRPGRGSIMAKIIIPKHPMPVIPITKPELKDLAAFT